ncbi:hypothetical protein GCM10010094_39870 [Streptomyces flaveus]|uniref:Uncharacterized protein n=1 Tax=Streptomyces flaveus TaxID=66370 RepID=A0A917QYE2_9ACTN|nr:hypothetical protein GCM10010094_39870 [Streptomyces flaveus]
MPFAPVPAASKARKRRSMVCGSGVRARVASWVADMAESASVEVEMGWVVVRTGQGPGGPVGPRSRTGVRRPGTRYTHHAGGVGGGRLRAR